MPVPLSYPLTTKGSFITPRTAPPPPKYSSMVFERSDMENPRRSNRLNWINDSIRNHIIAMLGELVGTTLFLFFSLAAAQTANNKPDTIPLPRPDGTTGGPSLLQILYISLGFGLSLTANVWAFFRISGGMFNPAVSSSGLV
jgi:aquaporin related protein